MCDLKLIGKGIRVCRKQRGLTLEVASGLAGIDTSHLSRIENGEYTPQLDTFIRIAFALGMAPSALMAYIEEMGMPISPKEHEEEVGKE